MQLALFSENLNCYLRSYHTLGFTFRDRTVYMPSHSLAPVAPEERIAVLDILRGFALLGICIINMPGFALPWAKWASGEIWFPGPLDQATNWLVNFLGTGKFNSIFSFLFGVGLTIQMDRAAARSANFAPVYLRRIGILLLFGLIHLYGIWAGDVLHVYAMLGFGLLLLRRMSDKWVFTIIILSLLAPFAWGAYEVAINKPPKHTPSWYSQRAREQVQIYSKGTYTQQVADRAREIREGWTSGWGWFLASMSVTMLLGFYAGRRRIFQNLEANLDFIRRIRNWCLLLGGATALGYATAFLFVDRTRVTAFGLVTGSLYELARPLLCLFYLSAITLLCLRPGWTARLQPLAMVGRMPLTNYLMQSVIATTVFYSHGLGWFGGRFGPFYCTLLAVTIYLIQVAYSYWWMQRYSYGPLEWLWRYLTYGTAPAMRGGAAATIPDSDPRASSSQPA